MTYVPLKKQINFTDHAQDHPSYRAVMQVLKACGDIGFKAWLIDHIKTTTCDSVHVDDISSDWGSAHSELVALGVLLDGLVSREAYVEIGVIESCKKLFVPTPDLPAIILLRHIAGFLLNMQMFERKIIEIDTDFDNGVMPARILTRDGGDASYIPRSREATRIYGN